MTKAAAIAAQLVDVRNVNTHKCVRMTIDVPAEQAMMVVEAFGWPTQVNPVPVAIARLDLSNARLDVGAPSGEVQAGIEGSIPSRSTTPDTPHKPRKPVAADKRLAQQAGICCADPVFQLFLMEDHQITGPTEDQASEYVRAFCKIGSRSEIIPGSNAADRWEYLRGRFLAWKLAA